VVTAMPERASTNECLEAIRDFVKGTSGFLRLSDPEALEVAIRDSRGTPTFSCTNLDVGEITPGYLSVARTLEDLVLP
jgi:hypothetical protein